MFRFGEWQRCVFTLDTDNTRCKLKGNFAIRFAATYGMRSKNEVEVIREVTEDLSGSFECEIGVDGGEKISAGEDKKVDYSQFNSFGTRTLAPFLSTNEI